MILLIILLTIKHYRDLNFYREMPLDVNCHCERILRVNSLVQIISTWYLCAKNYYENGQCNRHLSKCNLVLVTLLIIANGPLAMDIVANIFQIFYHISGDIQRISIFCSRKKFIFVKMSNSVYIWAKMKGYSAWPAKICSTIPQNIKQPKTTKKLECVYFFGTDN